MTDSPILFVSAGMFRPKKQDHPLARHRYLNYGLLGLASILHQCGGRVWMTHGLFANPIETLSEARLGGFLEGEYPVFLSVPSSFAIGWAAEFVRLLKAELPTKRVILGGRWVVGTDASWIRARIPGVDLVVFGTAESRIKQLLDERQWPHLPMTELSKGANGSLYDANPPELDYRILLMITETFNRALRFREAVEWVAHSA